MLQIRLFDWNLLAFSSLKLHDVHTNTHTQKIEYKLFKYSIQTQKNQCLHWTISIIYLKDRLKISCEYIYVFFPLILSMLWDHSLTCHYDALESTGDKEKDTWGRKGEQTISELERFILNLCKGLHHLLFFVDPCHKH